MRLKKNLEDYSEGYEDALTLFRDEFLNTIVAKEVFLEKEIASFIQDNTRNGYFRADIHDVAKHFFELGLTQSET